MKFIKLLFCGLFLICGLKGIILHGDQQTNIHHVQAEKPDTNGFWDKKVKWKSRWVKSWTAKKYYIPVWKKVWGPILLNEWIPLPKPPPGWLPHET